MPTSITNLKLLDPSTGLFVDVDYGNLSQGMLLLNILLELRVHTLYLQNMNEGLVTDDPVQLRADVASEIGSLQKFTMSSSN